VKEKTLSLYCLRGYWVLVCLAALALAGCEDQGLSSVPMAELTRPLAGDWYSVYFTQPGNPAMQGYRGGPDQNLADAIGKARLSVDVAVLDLDLWSLRDALIAAHRRGVAVRLVVESDYLDGKEIQELRQAGIPVLGDRREGLMHNKFAVIDRAEVWTGSMNHTVSESYRNNNNLIRLHSSRLAEDYTAEFEEMFDDDLFGPGSPANTPYPAFSVNGAQVKVYFSPDDGVTQRLVELILSAEESVYFLAYSLTSDDLAEALLERHQAGVEIAGVMEARQVESNTGSDYDRLRVAGIDVRLDGNPDNMHHKVLIIDGQTVVTGSFNFSRSAEERNDENTLVLRDPEIAALYLREFEAVYSEAQNR
jgi:phosphatidylserine/phosphatidylglycerophosphate/cardiolipin synthase-like enzyme